MKTNVFKILAIMLLVLAGMISCQTKSEDDHHTANLEGTKWKLVGIVDETGALKVLDSKDCEKYYTLRFDTDSTFLTFSSSNELGGGYVADYETYSFQVTYFGGTKIGETVDGELYSDLFWYGHIQSFSFVNNELKMFYNDNKNYLFFKSQQP